MAQLKLPAIFTDKMVLQYGREVNIWGWAKPGNPVEVKFQQRAYKTIADAKGNWQVKLAPLRAGASGAMFIFSGEQKIVISHVLAGEVWLCSGQSNMEFPLSAFKEKYAAEITASRDDALRYVVLENNFDNRERSNAPLRKSWTMVDSTTIGDCSATAYFFARKLRERLKVPVGLIISSWSGTPAQSWMDADALLAFPDYARLYNDNIRKIDFSAIEALTKQAERDYNDKKKNALRDFQSMTAPGYDDSKWENCTLPGFWEDQGKPDMDGIVAYRFTIDIPAAIAQQPAVLHLPAIDDIDSTYINGTMVGGYHIWNEKRIYQVAAGVLQAGKNTICIRVEDTGGAGGLFNEPASFYLQVGSQQIPLSGNAKMNVLLRRELTPGGLPPGGIQNQPGVLFNAMIAPLLPFTIRGVIWYQGESNVDKYVEYRTLFPAMINNWRQRFNNPELPFLFVQLAAYNPAIVEPAESKWSGLREAQAMTLKLPKTGMAVTIDVGDQTDIHPWRKKEVGERLAANAFGIVYGMKNEVVAGPAYKAQAITGNTITLSFDNTGKGLMSKGEQLMGFTIAGADKKFVPATAIIQGTTVIVSATAVANPQYVRYAWADAPMLANLYNKEGFPAGPFRTDGE